MVFLMAGAAVHKLKPNRAIKFAPAAKDAASTGLPTPCFGIRFWRRYESLECIENGNR